MSRVVITGASGGLGSELAPAFGRGGDFVLIHYSTRRAQAEALAHGIDPEGGRAFAFQADLRNREAIREMAREVLRRWKGIDLWINNAAVTFDAKIENLDEKRWDEVMDVNLSGAFFATQEAARIMIRQKTGQIINISSIVAQRGNAGQSAYAASKAGLIALTKSAAKELGRFNVQVNAVMPGFLPTRMTGGLRKKYAEGIARENTLGRSTDFSEVTRFVVHLASMKNVSGQVFNLDSRIY